MKNLQDLAAAITKATIAPPPGLAFTPARFAILLRSNQDPATKRDEIASRLASIKPSATVRFASPQEMRVVIAEFTTRSFAASDEADIFAAAYTMTDVLDVEAAEPDLPVGFFPQQPRSAAPKEPVPEGLGAFPSGCWAPAEPTLDARPRWAIEAMRVPEAWQFSEQKQRPSRGAGIVIAQPDTGITKHFELDNVVESNPANILNHTGDPTDPLDEDGIWDNPGHGTGTASVAVSPEADQVYGAAPKASHMSIRAVDSILRITQVSVAAAVDWAVDHGAHVITMSLGGLPSFTLHRAIRRAIGADIIVMAAAGNCVKLVVWPARYDDCIAVAGTDSASQAWRGSCQGSSVSVSAPAQNVYRARAARNEAPSSGQGQGTSFSVALTAGVAGLWLAHHGRANLVAAARARGETLQTMFKRLVKATAQRPPNWDSFNLGAGIVDARTLLEADVDVGRERESAPVPDVDAERSKIAIQSFVLESAGNAESLQADLDWMRFGPEIAFRILRSRLQPAVRSESAGLHGLSVSHELNESAQSKRLRDLLGLPKAEVMFE